MLQCGHIFDEWTVKTIITLTPNEETRCPICRRVSLGPGTYHVAVNHQRVIKEFASFYELKIYWDET